jgi:hypothetical protein
MDMIGLNSNADLDNARKDGTIRRRLKELVKRQKADDYARRHLAFLSPHLTSEEKAYFREVEQQLIDGA